MNDIFHPSWNDFFYREDVMKAYFEALSFSREERNKGKNIYPTDNNILKAFRLTPLNEINVVILGQDPYHNPGQATGLAFAVPNGFAKPPSLKNVVRELAVNLYDDGYAKSIYDTEQNLNTNLEHWAKQGVFLLNTILTVEENQPLSHKDKWQAFTDLVIKEVSKQNDDVFFCLWGKEAQKKIPLIDEVRHTILTAPHPSPLARGFIGCKHFSIIEQHYDIEWLE